VASTFLIALTLHSRALANRGSPLRQHQDACDHDGREDRRGDRAAKSEPAMGPSQAWRRGASWLCHFRALSLGDAARAPLDKLVAIFAVIFLGERLTMRDVAGIALITVGANHCAVNRPLLGSALFQANP